MLSAKCGPFCPGFNVNTLRPRQNGRHFADAILKCIFLNENVWISLKISLKFVPKVRINNIPALVQIMAWRRPGDKSLSELMMVSLLMHICITRPQWVKHRFLHSHLPLFKCIPRLLITGLLLLWNLIEKKKKFSCKITQNDILVDSKPETFSIIIT